MGGIDKPLHFCDFTLIDEARKVVAVKLDERKKVRWRAIKRKKRKKMKVPSISVCHS
jgi:hypothetical protein